MKKHHNATHGKSNSRVYRIWRGMINRCCNPNQRAFAKYEKLGICESWRNSFETFYADMGEPPTVNHTIDRKDNAKGYEPTNCRWATYKEQSENSALPKIITFNGKTQNVTEWARELNINQPSMFERLQKWPLEKALTQPKAKRFS